MLRQAQHERLLINHKTNFRLRTLPAIPSLELLQRSGTFGGQVVEAANRLVEQGEVNVLAFDLHDLLR